jgi:hypothetical protein
MNQLTRDSINGHNIGTCKVFKITFSNVNTLYYYSNFKINLNYLIKVSFYNLCSLWFPYDLVLYVKVYIYVTIYYQ